MRPQKRIQPHQPRTSQAVSSGQAQSLRLWGSWDKLQARACGSDFTRLPEADRRVADPRPALIGPRRISNQLTQDKVLDSRGNDESRRLRRRGYSHLWRRGCGRNRSVSQSGSDSALGRLRGFVGIGMQVIP
jgi:hypothetical protein